MKKGTIRTKSVWYAGAALLCMTAVMLAGGCNKPKPHVVTNYEVVIKPDNLLPASINVVEGNEVIWTNEDKVVHTLKSGTKDDPGDLFTVGPVAPGESVSRLFDKEGVYLYHFLTKPDQEGLVNVVKDTVVQQEETL